MKKDVYTISLYHNITISSFFCCFFNVSTIVMVIVMFMATFWSILIKWVIIDVGNGVGRLKQHVCVFFEAAPPLLLSSICGDNLHSSRVIFFVV